MALVGRCHVYPDSQMETAGLRAGPSVTAPVAAPYQSEQCVEVLVGLGLSADLAVMLLAADSVVSVVPSRAVMLEVGQAVAVVAADQAVPVY